MEKIKEYFLLLNAGARLGGELLLLPLLIFSRLLDVFFFNKHDEPITSIVAPLTYPVGWLAYFVVGWLILRCLNLVPPIR